MATLRAILELDPQEREAIDALDRIFEAGSNHRQRVEILRKRIDMAGDAAARQDLWRRVASLLERDVGDVDEAIAACVSILDENPSDDQAMETLARLYEQQGRHSNRLEILERRLALAPARSSERIGLLRQIAMLLEGPLGDPNDALGRWREVLETAPYRPGGADRARTLPGAGHRRRPAAGGGRSARADLRGERPLRRAGVGRPRLRRGAVRRARAAGSADAARGAGGDAPR